MNQAKASLDEMVEYLDLRNSMRPNRGRREYFTPEGKVALMYLKMYKGLSSPKLLEQLIGIFTTRYSVT